MVVSPEAIGLRNSGSIVDAGTSNLGTDVRHSICASTPRLYSGLARYIEYYRSIGSPQGRKLRLLFPPKEFH